MIARTLGGAIGFCLALALAGVAHAETIVLMPAQGDATLLPEALSAHTAVSRALEAQGVRTLAHSVAVDRAGGGELADCRTIECSAELTKAAKADLAVIVAVRAPDDDARAIYVQVALITAADAHYWGSAMVQMSDVGAAAREALLDARGYQLLGDGPFIRVHSLPSDAEVWIDDERAGNTPYRAALDAGRHTIELRKAGYHPHVEMRDLAQDAEYPIEVHVVLEAREAQATPPRLADVEGDPRDPSEGVSRPIVGPLVLGVLGAALITYDVVLIAGTGCERTEASGLCSKPSEVNTGLAIGLAAGGFAAIGGGLLWFLLGASDGAPASEPAVSARLTPLGSELRVRF